MYKVFFQKLAIIFLHRTDYSFGWDLQADFFNLYIVLGFDYHGYLMLMPVFWLNKIMSRVRCQNILTSVRANSKQRFLTMSLGDYTGSCTLKPWKIYATHANKLLFFCSLGWPTNVVVKCKEDHFFLNNCKLSQKV